MWSISPNYDVKQEKVLIGHQRWVWDCTFSADSAYLVTGYQTEVYLLKDDAYLDFSFFRPYRPTLEDVIWRDGPTDNGHHKLHKLGQIVLELWTNVL